MTTEILKVLLGLPYWSWAGMILGLLLFLFSFLLGYKATIPTSLSHAIPPTEQTALSDTRDLIALLDFRQNELRIALDAITHRITHDHTFIEHAPNIDHDIAISRALSTIKTLQGRVFPLIGRVMDALRQRNLVTAHSAMAEIHALSTTLALEQKELENVAEMLSHMAVGRDALARNDAALTQAARVKVSDFLTTLPTLADT